MYGFDGFNNLDYYRNWVNRQMQQKPSGAGKSEYEKNKEKIFDHDYYGDVFDSDGGLNPNAKLDYQGDVTKYEPTDWLSFAQKAIRSRGQENIDRAQSDQDAAYRRALSGLSHQGGGVSSGAQERLASQAALGGIGARQRARRGIDDMLFRAQMKDADRSMKGQMFGDQMGMSANQANQRAWLNFMDRRIGARRDQDVAKDIYGSQLNERAGIGARDQRRRNPFEREGLFK